jgi:hypothetical protein
MIFHLTFTSEQRQNAMAREMQDNARRLPVVIFMSTELAENDVLDLTADEEHGRLDFCPMQIQLHHATTHEYVRLNPLISTPVHTILHMKTILYGNIYGKHRGRLPTLRLLYNMGSRMFLLEISCSERSPTVCPRWDTLQSQCYIRIFRQLFKRSDHA